MAINQMETAIDEKDTHIHDLQMKVEEKGNEVKDLENKLSEKNYIVKRLEKEIIQLSNTEQLIKKKQVSDGLDSTKNFFTCDECEKLFKKQ